MLVPLSWLEDYVEIDIPPDELGEMLTMAGLELESIKFLGKGIEDVVVAEITNIEKHPNADKLSLCTVNDGESEYSVVCGADNMKKGDLAALAPSGSNLPPSDKFENGLKIKKTKIRGEISEGMLCAEDELGIGEKSEGIMILPDDLTIGSKLVDVLSLDEVIFDIAVTPNRPDCLSITGIAREVAAILGKRLKKPSIELDESGNEISKLIKLNVKDIDGCPRYSCRVIEGIKVGQSPEWLKSRLESSGIRSINNIVDVTNYVLLEYGQPLHAFDYDLLSGKKIEVRFAKKGEKITTLDGQERKLTDIDLLICDGKKPVALGGIMGGMDTEVTESTKNILIESAYFDPVTVRKTSKRTGLRSDSSYRFERGVDPNNVVSALNRVASLISQLAEGKISKSVIDFYPEKIEPSEIEVSPARINKTLGINISAEEIQEMVQSIELEVKESKKDKLLLKIPTFRVDITREVDVVEEVGRLFGYNNIPMVPPSVEMFTEEINSTRKLISNLKDIFISSGFFEAINYSFEDPRLISLFSSLETLKLINPLTSESSDMRTSLLPGLVKDLRINLSRQQHDVRLFECGKIYLPKGKGQLPKEETRFSAVATGRGQPEVWNNEEFNFFDLKNILDRGMQSLSLGSDLNFVKTDKIKFLHPGKSSKIFKDKTEIGFIGEIHPDYPDLLEIDKKFYILDFSVDILNVLLDNRTYGFKQLPRYPSVRRDISFIVNSDITAGEIISRVSSVSKLVKRAWVFDLFEGNSIGENKKSIGISMLLRSDEKTLTDEDANEIQNLAINELNLSLGAELRSN